MRMLLSTSAIVLILGLPSLTLAQTTPPASDTTQRTQTTDMPGLLDARGQSDVHASDLMGHDVYARRTPADGAVTEGATGMATDGMHGMAKMHRADLGMMDNIGKINEIVLSNDGMVRAIVIGAGGFLGLCQVV